MWLDGDTAGDSRRHQGRVIARIGKGDRGLWLGHCRPGIVRGLKCDFLLLNVTSPLQSASIAKRAWAVGTAAGVELLGFNVLERLVAHLTAETVPVFLRTARPTLSLWLEQSVHLKGDGFDGFQQLWDYLEFLVGANLQMSYEDQIRKGVVGGLQEIGRAHV